MQPFGVRLAAVSAVVAIGVGPLVLMEPGLDGPEAVVDTDPLPTRQPPPREHFECGTLQGRAGAEEGASRLAAGPCPSAVDADQNDRPIVMLTP